LLVTSPYLDGWAFAARGYIECLALALWMVAWFFAARRAGYAAPLLRYFAFGLLVGVLFWLHPLFLPVFFAIVLGSAPDVFRRPRRPRLRLPGPGAPHRAPGPRPGCARRPRRSGGLEARRLHLRGPLPPPPLGGLPDAPRPFPGAPPRRPPLPPPRRRAPPLA